LRGANWWPANKALSLVMKSPPGQPFGRRLLWFGVVLAAVCSASVIVAGLASAVSLAERIHPVAGQIVFWMACAAIAVGALWSAIAYARMPAALVAPDEQSPDYPQYI